jgi:DNA-binding LytR/AlgR family response regulator
MTFSALIAEDEPILAQALSTQLKRLWPELHLWPVAADGGDAVDRALAERPDVLFMDIQMPVLNGLEAAEQIMDQWPADRPLPLLVFVTAYDEYAVAAFERAAVDYVLKPVSAERLRQTCERLQRQLATRQAAGATPDDEDDLPDDDMAAPALHTLQALQQAQSQQASGQPPAHPQPPLKVIQAAIGQNLQMVQVQDVLYFEAADKYVRLITAQREASSELLIRTPLRELVPRLDADEFWQIHRSLVVNVRAIDKVVRQHGRMRVHVKGRDETLEVSRMYAHLFKAM